MFFLHSYFFVQMEFVELPLFVLFFSMFRIVIYFMSKPELNFSTKEVFSLLVRALKVSILE